MLHIGELLPFRSEITSFYRGREPLARLSRKGNVGLTVMEYGDIGRYGWAELSLVDVIFAQRAHGEVPFRFLQKCKKWGKKIVLDYDDDFFSLSEYHPAKTAYTEGSLSWTREILKMSDLVWVTTDHLKTQMELQGATNVLVVPNAHNDYLFPVENKKPTPKENIILYRGGDSHNADIAAWAENIVKSFSTLKDYTLTMFSGRHDSLDRIAIGRMNLAYNSPVGLEDYHVALSQMHASHGVTFLADTVFNRSKSNISWIEQSYNGSAFLAPRGLDEFDRPGVTHFTDLITPEMLKDASAKNEKSWNFIKENLLLSKVNELRYESLMSL